MYPERLIIYKDNTSVAAYVGLIKMMALFPPLVVTYNLSWPEFRQGQKFKAIASMLSLPRL